MASHSLVRIGYSHSDVMEMDHEDLELWLKTAHEYNKLVENG